MSTCETLIRSRYVETRPGVKEYRRLVSPEPCGEGGMLYEIRARKANQRSRKKDDAQQTFMGVKTWYIEEGSVRVRQTLCDKHRKKAEREGKKVEPIE